MNANKVKERAIIELSEQGKFPKDIAKELGYKYANTLRIIKKLGLTLEGRGGKNRIVHENPFIKKDGDYWKGYLAADGCLSKLEYSIVIQLKDLDILEEYRLFVSDKLNTHFRLNAAGSTMGSVYFRHQPTWDYLNDLGITPTKSRTLHYKGDINWNFIRGYFDGDGSVSQGRPKITTGSRPFKDQLVDFLNINGLETYICTKGVDIYDIYIKGNSRIDFFNNMYGDGNVICLERKYIKYRAALKKFRVIKERVNSGKV